MSGHSKWHKLKNKKGKTDSQRANLFTKLCRNVTMAAQQGGGDPDMNFSLRLAIEKAKAGNVPKDNIDRAIKRGTGELSDGTTLESIIYEGFGPGGVAFLIEAVTDNKNRTVSDLKHLFAEHGGSLGGPGSVQWQFVHLGVIRIDENQKSKIKSQKSDFELAMIDVGVEDIRENEYGMELLASVEKFKSVLGAVKTYGIEPDESGLEWVAKEKLTVDDETGAKAAMLIEAIDALDDVKEVYTNIS